MEKKKRNLVILLILIVIVSISIYSLSKELGLFDTDQVITADATDQDNTTQRFEAPAFTLDDENGIPYSLSDFRGKYVIINFWGSWCSYCVEEMPDFQRASQTFNEEGDTIILSVNDTSTESSKQAAVDFIHENNYDMLVLYDLDGKVADSYNVRGYPTTYVVDKEGYVFGYQAGSLSEENLYDVINRLRERGD